MNKQYNPNRLKVARLRRKMTLKSLSECIGMSSKMVSAYENETSKYIPTFETLMDMASALGYPIEFFYGDDIESLDASTVSFRSLKSMKAADQHAAIAAGQLGFLLSEFFSDKFSLPKQDIPDFRGFEPEVAAEAIREHWGLGNKSIKNVVHLLEAKGVRVFSLSENTADVDAFSFWKDSIPFVFLNTKKSGERSRFDAAHELGHLLLHRHGSVVGRDAESEADNFASAFLMPRTSVFEIAPGFATIKSLIKIKGCWLVSLMALIVRMKNLSLLTEWQYRSLLVEATGLGYRTGEPNGIDRERSLLFDKLLPALKANGIDIPEISRLLNLPTEEVSALLFRPTAVSIRNDIKIPSYRESKPKLTLVK
ncbi:ImmA/IrrE family metallo-endopeptidase [Aeromonas veronii]